MSILKLKDSQGNWIGVPTVKGSKGDKGNGISSATLNNDYTLTLTFTDGTSYTTSSIRGEKGEKGEPATDMDIHICSASEYESQTRIPTIAQPDDKTFYLVPTEGGTSPDLFTEWVYVNNTWEMFGSASIDLSGYLTDVQVNGTSVVNNGVASIPIASGTQAGVVKVNNTGAYGLLVENQELLTVPAASNVIKDGTDMFRPIAPKKQHESAFYGLAKASGHDEKDSTLPVGQYSDEAKSSIQDMLDVPSNSELKEVKDSKADVIVESASGDIVSFDDGADDMLLKSLVVDINPVQNLNGYDSPWVGGGGKNLLDPTLLKDQEAWNIIEMEFPEGTRLLMSTNKPSTAYTGGLFLYFRNGDVDTLSTADAVYNNQSVVHTVNSSGKIQIVQRNRDKTDSFANYWYQLEVMTSGTTPTDYAPYENICPINGWTGMNVVQTGFNQWDEEWELGDYHVSVGHGEKRNQSGRIRCKNFIPVVPNETYYCTTPDAGNTIGLFYDENKTYGSGSDRYVLISNRTFVIPEWAHYMTFYLVATGYNNDISINYPSTDHDYHSYTGQVLPISWQTEAGTVYGGKLDVLSGKLVIDRAMVDLGTLNWAYSNTEFPFFVTNLPIKRIANWSEAVNAISSMYYAVSGVSFPYTTTGKDLTMAGTPNESKIRIRNLAYTVPSDFKSAMSGVQLCYELAEPITIQLTPQEVKSLLGQNNIWADTGNTSVEYCADTEMYIEKVKPVVNVDDVQINGTSIVENGVAEIPVVTSYGKTGAVKINQYRGLAIENGVLVTQIASDGYIKGGAIGYAVIDPIHQHKSVFYGLAKSAGADEKDSTLAVGNYTDNAKDKIQTMLGVSPLIAPHESDPFESAHVVGELFIINGKLYRAKTALTAGEYINEGTNVEVVDVAEVLDSKVDDVQIDSTSIVTDGVANVPIGLNRLGAVQVTGNPAYGLNINGNTGIVTVASANDAEVKAGTLGQKPIAPQRQHMSTFYGLAKVAGDTTQSQSDNAVGTYTDEAKTAIKQMLGVHDTIDSFVEEVTGTDVTITGQPSYRYNCGELYSLTVTPPSSGTIDIRFISGSTPTVLTLPSTVKMPEWWVEVEANTIYEMCITDGIYCGVMTWAI